MKNAQLNLRNMGRSPQEENLGFDSWVLHSISGDARSFLALNMTESIYQLFFFSPGFHLITSA